MSGISPTMKSQRVELTIIAVLGVVLLAVLAAGFGKPKGAAKAPADPRREWMKGDGAFFVRKNCTDCHSISAFGIRAASLGPDLSDAAVDTQRRFGKTLEEFLRNPNGTMSIVLATKIPLTEAEKQEAIRLLKVAYRRKLEQRAQLNK